MPDQPNCALFDAIDKNDLLEVQKAFRDGADANALDEDGDTALFKATASAIENGDLKIMKLLLENRADPNIESGYSGAPIHHAAYWNASTDLVQLLLDKDANVNLQRHFDSSTPLIRATEKGNLELARLLLQHGADPNLQNDSDGAPLHIAAYNGRCKEIIDLLLANKANVNLNRCSDGVTPLYEAVRGQEFEIAKKLYKEDSDLKITNTEGETLLHLAVEYDTLEFLDLFKWTEKCLIDINSVTSDNETPLMFATQARSEPGVEWLLQQGANVDIADNNEKTAFLMCAQRGYIEIAKKMINRSPNVMYGVDNKGRGAFHNAAGWGKVDFIEWLYNSRETSDVPLGQKKALDPNSTDVYGMTFIHWALDYFEPSIVENCLQFCKPNIVDEVDYMGNTPLHIALKTLRAEVNIHSILIERMSLSARCKRNKDGKSILSLAVENAIKSRESLMEGLSEDSYKDLFIFKLFKHPVDVGYSESGAWPKFIRTDPDHVDYIAERLNVLFRYSSLPKTIIFWAARNGAKGLVNDGLTRLTDLDERNKVISETLYWASASEQKGIVDSLVNAYRNEVRDEAKTIEAVRAAAFAGYEPIVQSLLYCIRTDEHVPIREASGLFWALTWKSEHARDVVRRLLMNGASLNSIAEKDRTILQWAMDYQNKMSTSAGKETDDMLSLLECPIRAPPRPEAPKRPEAKDCPESEANKHVCTISDFYCQDGVFYTLQRRRKCRDVIYTGGVAKKMEDSWNVWLPKDESRMPDFRWVHLPVNDWDLVQDLVDSIYFEITQGGPDLEYTRCKTFVRGSQKEHTGSPQSTFMYPAVYFQTRDHGSGESSTVIQYLENRAKLRDKKAKEDEEKPQTKDQAKDLQKTNARDDEKGRNTKWDADASIARTQKKNPTLDGEGNNTGKSTMTIGGGATLEKTEDQMTLNPTAARKEDAENRGGSLTDAPIKKENKSHFPGGEDLGKPENLVGNKSDPGNEDFPLQGAEQSMPEDSLTPVGRTIRQAELDTGEEQKEHQFLQPIAGNAGFDANPSSISVEKTSSGEWNSTTLQVPQEGQANKATSTFGDSQSAVSQKGTIDDPKHVFDRSQKHPAANFSSSPKPKSDRAQPQDTSEQKKQLEKCKVALYMPFLTFQTVGEQRKRRQDIAKSESAAKPQVSPENAASKRDPRDHIKQTYKALSLAAAEMLESKSSPCSELSRDMIFKAIRCSTRHHQASGQDLNSESAAKLLKSHVASMDEDKKLSLATHRSPFPSNFWKTKYSGSPQKKESTTDMNQAIEYFIDAFSLAENVSPEKGRPKESLLTESSRVFQSQDLTNQTDSSASSRRKGKIQSGQTQQRHQSRTLDQYFYSSLPDTVRRDADQVIVRYQANKGCPDIEVHEYTGENASSSPKNNKNTKSPTPRRSNQETTQFLTKYLKYQEKFKLCVVDQLWLWVLDDKTIITCFPHTEKTGNEDKDHQNSPMDLICDHINREMRPQIQNVYHLAALITSFCASSIDRCQARIGDGKETLLDMFAESIGLVADKEVMLFNSFKNRLGVDVSDLNLDDDIELLEEIKDIRDELNILERILDDQEDLTQKLFNLFEIETCGTTSTKTLQDQVLQYYQQRASVELRLDRIKKMDEDAKISYDAINFLLDLKQKHANVMEAKTAREQAQETADQGRTILVFTIVTIVFAPLSFLSSFFALNIETFPHSDGDISFPSSWIYWRVYGISVAIFVPLVVGTLAYGPMKTGWEKRNSDRKTRLSSNKNINLNFKSLENIGTKEAVDSHCHDKLTQMIRNRRSCWRRAQSPDVESGKP